MFFKNKKVKSILSTFLILLLAVIASGFVWMDTHEGSRTRAADNQTSISSCDTSLSGYAWTENIGWISMSGSGYSVNIDKSTGLFSGWAWSENIGWINFAPSGPYPNSPTPPQYSAQMDTSTGNISGWASVLINQSDPTPTGWIKMSDTSPAYGVKVDAITGQLSGFAWSENYGWIDFSQVTYGCVTGGGGVNGLAYNDGILVFTSAQRQSATNGDASVTSSGGGAATPDNTMIYSLVITNQGNAPKVVNLKFNLPYGFTHLINTTTCTAGITPCNSPPEGGVTGNGSNMLTWSSVTVPIGASTISFKLKAP